MEKVTTTIRIPKKSKQKLEWLKHYYGIGSVSDIIHIWICRNYQEAYEEMKKALPDVELSCPEPLPSDILEYLLQEVHWKDN